MGPGPLRADLSRRQRITLDGALSASFQADREYRNAMLDWHAFATIEPADLEALLSTKLNDFDFGPRREITFPMLGDGIFAQHGAAWGGNCYEHRFRTSTTRT